MATFLDVKGLLELKE